MIAQTSALTGQLRPTIGPATRRLNLADFPSLLTCLISHLAILLLPPPRQAFSASPHPL
jgi:hypothetical protein